MADLTGAARARYVQAMFARIASRYDLMNRLMTAGQDRAWRREVIRRAALQPGDRLLDLGAGTGDLAQEALRQRPDCRPLAADFTLEMMRVGRGRAGNSVEQWSAADALRLPFSAETFDALASGFLLRNVIDLRAALCEQYRVLKPGGRWVALDTTRPRRNLLSPFIHLHLHYVIPVLGRLLTGQADAYTYLPASTESFLTAEGLAAQLVEAGFRRIGFRRRMFGAVAIHWAKKWYP
ncbi:MAG TPA: ubiquinone/menaquinone biosynthesis methyltransferase [Anaerolineae bacterium]|nr:ubiquinone/menaquinone biosynthesis methyltransferase [Anaerolineae bacterium]